MKNRLTRLVWATSWFIFARFTPPQLHAWRCVVLRAFGAKLGRKVRIHGSARVWLPSNLELADQVLVGPGVNLYNQGRIKIGARSVISQGSHLCASTHDYNDPNFQLVVRPISIGEDCWIATDAFVGPGAVVADRVVVGARSSLFGRTVADGIYAGSPAKWIKQRMLRVTRAEADA